MQRYQWWDTWHRNGTRSHKAAYVIMMCLEVFVYKKLEVITESTSPDRQLSGTFPNSGVPSETAVYTGVHSPKAKKKQKTIP